MFLPPLLSCNGFSFPFEVILSDWVFKDLRTLDVCLAWDTRGDNLLIHLMYVLVINLRVLPMNLGIGVGTCFRLDPPVESLGHSLKFFVLVWIDGSEIVWCISYNHTHGYLRWHWSIQVTLGFWLICVLRCYSSTNSRVVCDTYRNSPMDWLERITLRWFRTLP